MNRSTKQILFERMYSIGEMPKPLLCENDIDKSIWSLIRYNNGHWKSEKQRDFIIKTLKQYSGNIGSSTMYGNTVSYTAEWDDDGITKVTEYSHKKHTRKIKWERNSNHTEFLDNKISKEKRKKDIEQYYKDIERYEDLIKKEENALVQFVINNRDNVDNNIINKKGLEFQNNKNKYEEEIEHLKDLIHNPNNSNNK